MNRVDRNHDRISRYGKRPANRLTFAIPSDVFETQKPKKDSKKPISSLFILDLRRSKIEARPQFYVLSKFSLDIRDLMHQNSEITFPRVNLCPKVARALAVHTRFLNP